MHYDGCANSLTPKQSTNCIKLTPLRISHSPLFGSSAQALTLDQGSPSMLCAISSYILRNLLRTSAGVMDLLASAAVNEATYSNQNTEVSGRFAKQHKTAHLTYEYHSGFHHGHRRYHGFALRTRTSSTCGTTQSLYISRVRPSARKPGHVPV